MEFFFFSSRRRHTRYWRDWSSDVCSSDLVLRGTASVGAVEAVLAQGLRAIPMVGRWLGHWTQERRVRHPPAGEGDRESGVVGKRGDLGGGRIVKKKKPGVRYI